MKIFKLDDMTRGWFVGDFSPSVLRTENFEVGVKKYKAGDKEAKHFHRQSKEITLIITGKVKMNGTEYSEGDILLIEENEATDFHALEDTVTVVARNKSISNDKFLGDGV